MYERAAFLFLFLFSFLFLGIEDWLVGWLGGGLID